MAHDAKCLFEWLFQSFIDTVVGIMIISFTDENATFLESSVNWSGTGSWNLSSWGQRQRSEATLCANLFHQIGIEIKGDACWIYASDLLLTASIKALISFWLSLPGARKNVLLLFIFFLEYIKHTARYDDDHMFMYIHDSALVTLSISPKCLWFFKNKEKHRKPFFIVPPDDLRGSVILCGCITWLQADAST